MNIIWITSSDSLLDIYNMEGIHCWTLITRHILQTSTCTVPM